MDGQTDKQTDRQMENYNPCNCGINSGLAIQQDYSLYGIKQLRSH